MFFSFWYNLSVMKNDTGNYYNPKQRRLLLFLTDFSAIAYKKISHHSSSRYNSTLVWIFCTVASRVASPAKYIPASSLTIIQTGSLTCPTMHHGRFRHLPHLLTVQNPLPYFSFPQVTEIIYVYMSFPQKDCSNRITCQKHSVNSAKFCSVLIIRFVPAD